MDFGNTSAEVVELVLTPFSDIVTRARNAASNASTNEPLMHKAATSLEKEGQRALVRLEPLFQMILEQHGTAFANAIRAKGDVGRFHLELTDLLWEFEDYVSVETFNENKYANLQSLCRSIAPKLYNILVQIRVELLTRITTAEIPLRFVPESPPRSPLYPFSPTTETYPPSPSQSRIDHDTHHAGASPWRKNSFKGYQSEAATNLQKAEYPTRDACSASTPNLYFANSIMWRQSGSSEHSSRSSGSYSRCRFVSQSVTPIHGNVERFQCTSRAWQLPSQTTSSHGSIPPRKASLVKRVSSGPTTSRNLRKGVTFEHAVRPPMLPPKNCIITASSSFHIYKGFCSGAQQVLNGHGCVRQKQKPVQRALPRIVSKCTGCSMEFDSDSIKADLSNTGGANLVKKDVGYRPRFLQKSHLPVKRASDTLYGCLFCVSTGHTIEESDATVFFSAEDLFTHLSRHPHPLPPVSGIAVIYGVDIPPKLRNNYDLHFKFPPKANPIHRERTEIDGRPTGIATKETRKTQSLKRLIERDRPKELQLAVGAKVTGIKWPPQYKGRRVFAWHDGVYASVPSENVMLIPPRNPGLTKFMGSHVSAKAKWKFSMKSETEFRWLKFDKGEAITNIGWEHSDHWCWCGTTSKGNWGFFPQAYIDHTTVQGDEYQKKCHLMNNEYGSVLDM